MRVSLAVSLPHGYILRQARRKITVNSHSYHSRISIILSRQSLTVSCSLLYNFLLLHIFVVSRNSNYFFSLLYSQCFFLYSHTISNLILFIHVLPVLLPYTFCITYFTTFFLRAGITLSFLENCFQNKINCNCYHAIPICPKRIDLLRYRNLNLMYKNMM